MNKNLIEQLLSSTMPFIEDLIIKYKEFYPVACALDKHDEICQVGTYNGTDYPDSIELCSEFKKIFRLKKMEYKAVMIFYMVTVKLDSELNPSNAIAVFTEVDGENNSYSMFYTYTLSENSEIVFGKSWRESSEAEIFVVSA